MADQTSEVRMRLSATDNASAVLDKSSAALDRIDASNRRAAAGSNVLETAAGRQARALKELQDRTEGLKALDRLTQIMDGAARSLQTAQNRANATATELQHLGDALRTSQQTTQTLTTQLGATNAAITQQRTNVASLGTAHADLTRQVAATSRSLAELQAREVKGTTPELTRQIQAQTSALADLRGRQAASAAQLAGEKAALAESLSARRTLNTEIRKTATDSADTQTRMQALQARQASQQRAVADAQIQAQNTAAAVQRPSATLGVTANTAAIRAAQAEAKAAGDALVSAQVRSAVPPIPEGTISSYRALNDHVLHLALAFAGLHAAGEKLHSVMDAYKVMEAATNRLGVVFKQDPVATATELSYLNTQATRLGVSFATLSNEYGKFAIAAQGANYSTNETRKVFISLAEAGRVTKLSSDQMGRAFLAVQQMISKGTVSAEELKGQLGEVLPGAFSIFAASIGKTDAELTQLMSNGAVKADSNTLLKFADELRNRFGGQLAESMTTVTTALASFENATFKANLAIGQGGFMKSLGDLVRTLTDLSQTKEANDFFLGVGAALGKATDAITFLLGHLDLLKYGFLALTAVKIAGWVSEWILGMRQMIVASQSHQVEMVGLTGTVKATQAGILTWSGTATYWGGIMTGMSGAARGFGVATVQMGAQAVSAARNVSVAGVAMAATNGVLGLLRIGAIALTAAWRTMSLVLGGPLGIAITALTLIAGKVFTDWATKTDEATAALSEHQRQLQQVAAGYDEAGKAIDGYKAKVSRVQAEDAFAGTQKALGKAQKAVTAEFNKATDFSLPGSKEAEQIQPLFDKFKQGAIDSETLQKALYKLRDEAGNDEGFKKQVLALLRVVESLRVAEKNTGNQAQIFVKVSKEAGALASTYELAAGVADKFGNKINDLNGQLDGNAKKLLTAAQMAKAYQDSLDKIETDVPGRKNEIKAKADQTKADAVGQAEVEALANRFQAAYSAAEQKGDKAEMDRLNEEYMKSLAGLAKAMDNATGQIQDNLRKMNRKDAETAIKESGLDLDQYANRVIKRESGDRNVRNASGPGGTPTSSASGYGQFIDATFVSMAKLAFPELEKASDKAILANRGNREFETELIKTYAIENAKALQAGGAPITRTNLALAHQFDGPMAAKIANADADTMIKDVVTPAQYKANLTQLAGKTVGEIRASFATAMAENYKVDGKGLTEAEKADKDLGNTLRKNQESRKEDLDKAKFTKQNEDDNDGNKREAYAAKYAYDEEAKDRKAIQDAQNKADEEGYQLDKSRLSISAERKAALLEEGRLKYDAVEKDKDDKKAAEEALQKLRDIVALRTSMQNEAKTSFKEGDVGKYEELKKQLVGVTEEANKAADAALKLAQAVGGKDGEHMVSQINTIKNTMKDYKNEIYTAKQANQDLASGLTTATMTSFNEIFKAVDGTEKWGKALANVANAFRKFASDFLAKIAQMILQQMFLNALSGMFGGTGGGLGGLISGGVNSVAGGSTTGALQVIGAKHTGGLIDGGMGAMTRTIAPLTSRPPAFHDGGIVGPQNDEQLIMAQKGEEMLTKNSPRHIQNFDAFLKGMSGGGGISADQLHGVLRSAMAGQKAPIVNNLIDPGQMMQAGFSTAAGTRSFINFLRDNATAANAALGK